MALSATSASQDSSPSVDIQLPDGASKLQLTVGESHLSTLTDTPTAPASHAQIHPHPGTAPTAGTDQRLLQPLIRTTTQTPLAERMSQASTGTFFMEANHFATAVAPLLTSHQCFRSQVMLLHRYTGTPSSQEYSVFSELDTDCG